MPSGLVCVEKAVLPSIVGAPFFNVPVMRPLDDSY